MALLLVLLDLIDQEGEASRCLLAREKHVGRVYHNLEDEKLVPRHLLEEELQETPEDVLHSLELELLLHAEVADVTLESESLLEPSAQAVAVDESHATLALARLDEGTLSAETYPALFDKLVCPIIHNLFCCLGHIAISVSVGC